MTERFYTGARIEGAPPLFTPASMVRIDTAKTIDPKGYLPDQGLVDAVNVALMLQQPLLLSGEPGTGKTQLAFSVADQLGLRDPLVFETKSTSTSQDLFYTFDNLRRFQAAQAQGSDIDPRLFIQFNALGRAIIRTKEAGATHAFLPPGSEEAAPHPHRSLVLIDEIDKAPRDFPNDILNEIEQLYFRIPELGNVEVRADPALRPIVIITSNSEKSLPDAFLRRCIFYHIPFPEARLEEILTMRVSGLTAGDGTALAEILDFFVELRSDAVRLRKPPGTAELLQWVLALLGFELDPAQPLRRQAAKAAHTLGALAKHPEDQAAVLQHFKEWVNRLRPQRP